MDHFVSSLRAAERSISCLIFMRSLLQVYEYFIKPGITPLAFSDACEATHKLNVKLVLLPLTDPRFCGWKLIIH